MPKKTQNAVEILKKAGFVSIGQPIKGEVISVYRTEAGYVEKSLGIFTQFGNELVSESDIRDNKYRKIEKSGAKLDEGAVSPLEPTNKESVSKKLQEEKFLSEVFEALCFNSEFKRKLKDVFAELGLELSIRAINVLPIKKDITSEVHKLWEDFSNDDTINPVKFIQKNYGKMDDKGKWLNCGLTRPDLKHNKGLYNAYAKWIERHPKDALEFAPGGGKKVGRPATADPFEALDRRRANDSASKRRKRERSSPSDGPS